jgi:uncharacterized membrane protein
LIRFDEKLLDDLEAAVTELERDSSLEVVIAVASQSGVYRDLQMGVAAGLAWIVMGLLVFLPVHFPDIFLFPSVALAFGLGYVSAHGRFFLRMVPSRRKRQQVEDAARTAFFREHVGGTRKRHGLLVYLSHLEADLEILPDYGVQSCVPAGVWNELRANVLGVEPSQRWSKVVEEMRRVAPTLAAALPRESDDTDELPNRPRLLV